MKSRRRQKPDLFFVVLVLLALGMSITLAYQVHLYYGLDPVPIAEHLPDIPIFGG